MIPQITSLRKIDNFLTSSKSYFKFYSKTLELLPVTFKSMMDLRSRWFMVSSRDAFLFPDKCPLGLAPFTNQSVLSFRQSVCQPVSPTPGLYNVLTCFWTSHLFLCSVCLSLYICHIVLIIIILYS